MVKFYRFISFGFLGLVLAWQKISIMREGLKRIIELNTLSNLFNFFVKFSSM